MGGAWKSERIFNWFCMMLVLTNEDHLSDVCVCTCMFYFSLFFRMKLGMFDPPELQPYMSLSPEVVNSKEHQVPRRVS